MSEVRDKRAVDGSNGTPERDALYIRPTSEDTAPDSGDDALTVPEETPARPPHAGDEEFWLDPTWLRAELRQLRYLVILLVIVALVGLQVWVLF